MSNSNNLFPCYMGKTARPFSLFVQATKLHKRANQPEHVEDIAKAVHCYQAAFDSGLLEAGVNLLSIVVSAMLRYKITQPDEPVPFQDKALAYITALEDAGYEEASYYQALCLIYNLLETGNAIDSDSDNGFMLMKSLAYDGYTPAIEFLDMIQAEDSGN